MTQSNSNNKEQEGGYRPTNSCSVKFYFGTNSVLDYIAECFEAQSLKEVSLAAAAHFDRQILIRVEKFSGLKKTLNNFNVQTNL